MDVGDVVKFVGGVRVDGGAMYKVIEIYGDSIVVSPIRPLPSESETLAVIAREFELEVIARGPKH